MVLQCHMYKIVILISWKIDWSQMIQEKRPQLWGNKINAQRETTSNFVNQKRGIEAEAQSVEHDVPWWNLGRRLSTERCTSYDFRFPVIEAMISFKMLISDEERTLNILPSLAHINSETVCR